MNSILFPANQICGRLQFPHIPIPFLPKAFCEPNSPLLSSLDLHQFFISGSPEALQNSTLATQIRDLSQRLGDIIEEGQRSVSPPFTDLLDRFSSTIENLQTQIDILGKYNWDFDHYLEEDVPAAVMS